MTCVAVTFAPRSMHSVDAMVTYVWHGLQTLLPPGVPIVSLPSR